jgi:hypothetical protein
MSPVQRLIASLGNILPGMEPDAKPADDCSPHKSDFFDEWTNLLERSDPRFRSGQTRERNPSNAWARKIAAPTKPITAVIVSNITNVLYATAREKPHCYDVVRPTGPC